MYAVPQILTRKAEDFIRTVELLKEYGYREVNLNLGCPSKTVVTKGCGAGFLKDPGELERFLDTVFEKCDMKISVKTRLGMEDASEFSELMKVYNKFPLEELIIHPRVQKDFYKNTPNLSAFAEAFAQSRNPVCYNGDIFCVEDYRRIQEKFPELGAVMTAPGSAGRPGSCKRTLWWRKTYEVRIPEISRSGISYLPRGGFRRPERALQDERTLVLYGTTVFRQQEISQKDQKEREMRGI